MNQKTINFLTTKWTNAGQWQQPDTDNALLFALTELGEAVECWQRMKTGFVRNNPRTPENVDAMATELADVALMCYVAAASIGRDLDAALSNKLLEMDEKRQ